MTTTPRSYIVKLNWAGIHLRFLQERVQAFIDSKPHKVEPQLDPDTGEVVIYGEALRELPTHEWGVIIGDIVHNLRSALDHMVWALTLAHQPHPPPIPIPKKGTGSEWKDTGFPIYPDPYPVDTKSGNLISWATSKEPKSLWGIDPSLRADFQALQPFNHGKHASAQPLAVLHELWNIDKHRHIQLTNFYVILNNIIAPSTPEKHLLSAQLEAARSFKERTELGRVRKFGGTVPLREVDVNPTLFSDVAFAEGPPAYGARLVQILESFHKEVAVIIVKFQPHLP